MKRILKSLAVAAILCGLVVAPALAQLDGSVGYGKWLLVPENAELAIVQEDALSASLSWRVNHLSLVWSMDEDAIGYAAVGYGDTYQGVDWAVMPAFVLLNHLGEDGTFGAGALVRLGFSVPTGEEAETPVEFLAGWTRTIRAADIGGVDEHYHAVTLQLRTTFAVRR
jgi:hypothetical protein